MERDRSEGIRNIGGIRSGLEVKTGTGLNTVSHYTCIEAFACVKMMNSVSYPFGKQPNQKKYLTTTVQLLEWCSAAAVLFENCELNH